MTLDTPDAALVADALPPIPFTYRDIHGWFDFEDVYEEMVDRHSLSESPSTFVEIGAWMGRSTAYMGGLIKEAAEYNTPSPITFYTVDTWRGTGDDPHFGELLAKHSGDIYEAFLANMASCGVTEYVHPIHATSSWAAASFQDASIDFIFVDGAHDYDSVHSDLTIWLPKLKVGGTMGGHDVGFPGVDKAVWEVLPDAKRYEGRTSGSTWVWRSPLPVVPAQEVVTS